MQNRLQEWRRNLIRPGTGWVLAAALIAAVPRVARLLSNRVWMEDSVVLYHGFTIGLGRRPFLDGLYSHPPLLEAVLGLCYRVFGVSYRVAELLSAAAMVLSALLVFDICRRLTNRGLALVGVAAFSFSPLLIRYHVCEREVFTAAAACLALWLLLVRPDHHWAAIVGGLLAVVAAAVKLSGAFLLPPLVLYLLLQNRPQQALRLLVAGIVGGILLALYLFARYGREAIYQLFILQMIAGSRVPVSAKVADVLLPWLNYLTVFGLGGLTLALVRRPRGFALPASLLAGEFLFFFWLKGSIWPHNFIDLLPLCSVGGVIGVHELHDFLRSRRLSPRLSKAATAAVFTLMLAVCCRPAAHLLAWGYIPRGHVMEAARFLRENTRADSVVSAPHYIACEAQRIKLFDYRELEGPYRWMRRTLEQEGLGGLGRYKDFGPWERMMVGTYRLWRGELDQAIRHQRLDAVVWDAVYPEWALYQKVDEELEKRTGLLSGSGYRPAYGRAAYLIWLLPEAGKQTDNSN